MGAGGCTYAHCPVVQAIFIDEVDSLLPAQRGGENEGPRRLKTECPVQLDGAITESEGKLLIMGAAATA